MSNYVNFMLCMIDSIFSFSFSLVVPKSGCHTGRQCVNGLNTKTC